MRGAVPRGCRLLLNGASLLLEEGETNDEQVLWGHPDDPHGASAESPGGAAAGPAVRAAAGGGSSGSGGGASGAGGGRKAAWSSSGGSTWALAGGSLVCELSWMRFRALVDGLDLVCGVYVQVRCGRVHGKTGQRGLVGVGDRGRQGCGRDGTSCGVQPLNRGHSRAHIRHSLRPTPNPNSPATLFPTLCRSATRQRRRCRRWSSWSTTTLRTCRWVRPRSNRTPGV